MSSHPSNLFHEQSSDSMKTLARMKYERHASLAGKQLACITTTSSFPSASWIFSAEALVYVTVFFSTSTQFDLAQINSSPRVESNERGRG
jgi:hypothetical protein